MYGIRFVYVSVLFSPVDGVDGLMVRWRTPKNSNQQIGEGTHRESNWIVVTNVWRMSPSCDMAADLIEPFTAVRIPHPHSRKTYFRAHLHNSLRYS